jgi:hypothetical protein
MRKKFHGSKPPLHWAGEEMRIWPKNESSVVIVGYREVV